MSQTITLDAHGRQITLSRRAVAELRDAAATDAGSSSVRRDLSLVLDRALEQNQRVALRRSEVRALIHLIDAHGLAEHFPGLVDALTGEGE